MKFINTDGMAFIGPGSEWFWTAVSGLVLAVTFIAIYRQLRAQRSASVFDQMASWHRELGDVGFMHQRLEFLLDLENRDVADGLPFSGGRTGSWFERLGYLVAQGHLRPIDVWQDLRPVIAWWWALMGPYIERSRVINVEPLMYEWFEHLELEMQRLDLERLGRRFVHPATLAETIDDATTELQRERDAALGIIPTRKVAPATVPGG